MNLINVEIAYSAKIWLGLSQQEKEIASISTKIEEERNMKSYLSELVQSRKAQMNKQAATYSKDVDLAEALVYKINQLGIASPVLVKAFEKEKSKLERAQQGFNIEIKSLGLKAKSKLQQMQLLRSQNDELMKQFNTQMKVIKEQRLYLDEQYSKEEAVEYKRQEKREAYSNKLELMLAKYEREQSRLKVDMLQTAISEFEIPNTSQFTLQTSITKSKPITNNAVKDIQVDDFEIISSKETSKKAIPQQDFPIEEDIEDEVDDRPVVKVNFGKKDANVETNDFDMMNDSKTLNVILFKQNLWKNEASKKDGGFDLDLGEF